MSNNSKLDGTRANWEHNISIQSDEHCESKLKNAFVILIDMETADLHGKTQEELRQELHDMMQTFIKSYGPHTTKGGMSYFIYDSVRSFMMSPREHLLAYYAKKGLI